MPYSRARAMQEHDNEECHVEEVWGGLGPLLRKGPIPVHPIRILAGDGEDNVLEGLI